MVVVFHISVGPRRSGWSPQEYTPNFLATGGIRTMYKHWKSQLNFKTYEEFKNEILKRPVMMTNGLGLAYFDD